MTTLIPRVTLKIARDHYALLQSLQSQLDSPSLSSTLYFLLRQNQNLPPAEQTSIAPKSFTQDYPEVRALPPLHSIQVGNDTYNTLHHTKETLRLRSWDAAIQRYLYKTSKDTPDEDPDNTIIELQEQIEDLKVQLNESKALTHHYKSVVDRLT